MSCTICVVHLVPVPVLSELNNMKTVVHNRLLTKTVQDLNYSIYPWDKREAVFIKYTNKSYVCLIRNDKRFQRKAKGVVLQTQPKKETSENLILL